MGRKGFAHSFGRLVDLIWIESELECSYVTDKYSRRHRYINPLIEVVVVIEGRLSGEIELPLKVSWLSKFVFVFCALSFSASLLIDVEYKVVDEKSGPNKSSLSFDN